MSREDETLPTPTVSVIIATYKRAGVVPQAIRSVLRQSFQNFEVIVVDDASPDNTREVVQSIGDHRVQYIRHAKNKGPSAVRNTGIRAAAGRYIAFLDDDDEWREDKLEKQIKAIEKYDVVVCATQVNGKCVTPYNRKSINPSDLRRENQFPPSGLLAKTSVLKELLFDEELHQGEDWDVYIRIVQKYSIGYVSEPLLLYNDGSHQRTTNETRDLPLSELENRMRVIFKNREFFGPFWFQHNVAMTLLAYFGSRKQKIPHLIYTIRRCGILPVSCAFWTKIMRKVKRGWVV